jgi:hypothetical protein
MVLLPSSVPSNFFHIITTFSCRMFNKFISGIVQCSVRVFVYFLCNLNICTYNYLNIRYTVTWGTLNPHTTRPFKFLKHYIYNADNFRNVRDILTLSERIKKRKTVLKVERLNVVPNLNSQCHRILFKTSIHLKNSFNNMKRAWFLAEVNR